MTDEADQPEQLRRRALDLLLEVIDADVGLFTQVYVAEGQPRYGDLLACGPAGTQAQALAGLDGSPAFQGGVTTPAARAEPWRRGYWDVRMPRRRQRNTFRTLDDDTDRRALMDAPIWGQFYERFAIGDQLRALFYSGAELVGWFAALRLGKDGRFSDAEKAAVNARSDDFQALLTAAHARRDGLDGDRALYAVTAADGRPLHLTPGLEGWMDADGRRHVRRLVRQLDGDAERDSLRAFHSGVELQVVRMTGGPQTRYLVVVSQADVYELSPLHELTPTQRQVVECAVAGATNTEIAREMDISPSTVSTHMRNLYDRLGVASRIELVQLWEKG